MHLINIKYYFHFLGIACLIAVINTGCKKFVQANPPVTQIATTSVFANSGSATSAMLNVYEQMYSNIDPFNLEIGTGLLGDELINYYTAGVYPSMYTNSMMNTQTIYGPWKNAYNYIYQANAIIAGLQNNTNVASSIIQQLTGEAKFIRAFWYFYLVNCYGDVPMPVTTNYTNNASLLRTPKAAVYQQIIADLNDAQTLLSSKFVDASDTTVTTDRVRPTSWAATALLARVYLYTGNYTDAISQATTVINNTSEFSLVSDPTKVFLANSAEAIWQLDIVMPNSYNTPEGYYFIFKNTPTTASLSNYLINAFEPNDKRKANWIGTYTSGSVKYYYPYKYKSNTSTPISEYLMVLRLAEQFLIRAEAEAQTGDLTDGIADLNAIRSRAGLPNYSGAAVQNSVLNVIFHERQVELFTEWGHRWFDMVRTGNVSTILGPPGNVCQAKNGTWNSIGALFPIPQSEIAIDLALTQNPGYSN